MAVKFNKPSVKATLSNPLSVCWQVTKKCNYSCLHCIANAKFNEPGYYEMTTQEVKKSIDKLIASGVVRSDFTGGEPLLRHDITEIIDYATKKGMYCIVTSNGSVYSKKIADCLKRNKSLIQISIDGDEKTHELLREKGSYKKALNTLLHYTKQGIKTRINFTVTKKNYKKINYIYSLAKKHKISRLMYIFIAPQGRCSGKDEIYCLSGKKLELARKQVNEIKKKSKNVFITIHDYTINFKSCFLIEPNGDTISQGYSQDECTYAGNILRDSIKKIWESGHFDHLKHFIQYAYLFE